VAPDPIHRTINGGGYGQNLYEGRIGDPGNAVNEWYNNEIECYPDTAYGEHWDTWPVSACNKTVEGWSEYGHYAQVVWVDSLTVGCAATQYDNDYAGEVTLGCNF